MNIKNLLIASIAGTTVMTIFSHLLGKDESKRFNEAKNLARLHSRYFERYKLNDKDLITGYFLHYAVGILFTYLSISFSQNTSKRYLYSKELTIGSIAGAIGIIIWHLNLKLHPNPPKLNLKDYYFQLMMAHLLLTVTAIEVYKKLD